MLDKSKFEWFSHLNSKWVIKQWRLLCNINNTFGTGTANIQCSGGLRRCARESLEDEKCRSWPLKVDNDQVRGSSKLFLLQLHEKLLKNSTSTILWLFGIWSKLERWKSSIVCLMSYLKIKKNPFKVSSSLTLHNNKPFLNQLVMWNEKWILDHNRQ